ncbi:hypothetical protein [Caldicellulosiruptor acetigenus]|uniref:Fimbrial assembly family protein n=1 Tax=Caldicellulosiruptor acetigenus 6A TaxID=632516 RepID=G2PZ73_9FIRM|nr:hypothetical protein [Caldicellulosiruptor acetigenus]AEM74118.1 Fimbrial assembly family protein [Caldicellulosiruptor acetigenus 6A]
MPQTKDINLLEAYNQQFSGQGETANSLLKILVIVVIAVGLLVTAFLGVQIVQYSMRVDTLKKEVAVKKVMVEKIQNELKIKEVYEKKKGFVDLKMQENQRLKSILNTIESLTPTDVVFDVLQLENNVLMMKVSSKRLDSIEQFVFNVRNNSLFENVTYNGATVDDKKMFKADITTNVKWK